MSAPLRARLRARIWPCCGLILASALICYRTAAQLLFAELEPAPLVGTEGAGLAGYDFSSVPPDKALLLLAHGEKHRSIDELNRLVFESLAHGEPRPIDLKESWLASCMGLLWPDLLRTQDPSRLLRGRRGLCADAVVVLCALCSRSGLEAEMIDLSGHVVARVHKGARTWIADPDLGIVLPHSLEELTEPKGLAEVRDQGSG